MQGGVSYADALVMPLSTLIQISTDLADFDRSVTLIIPSLTPKG
jgi:hypothetical protein